MIRELLDLFDRVIGHGDQVLGIWWGERRIWPIKWPVR